MVLLGFYFCKELAMAKSAVAAKPARKPVAERGASARRPVKPAVDLSFLYQLASENKELEDIERAQAGGNVAFLSLVGQQSGVTMKGNPRYLPGVAVQDYIIHDKKANFGSEVDVTVLGIFKLYAEVEKKEANSKEMPRTFGFWNPADAEKFEVVGLFDRELPNGHVLQPVHWVYLYLHESPELDNVVLTLRSSGNAEARALAKIIKANSATSPELRFTLSSEVQLGKDQKTSWYAPKFDLQKKRNFSYDADEGALTDIKDPSETQVLLERAKQMREDYTNMRLVSKRNTAAITGGIKPVLAIGEAGDDIAEDADVQF
jgi:hypothetical protein